MSAFTCITPKNIVVANCLPLTKQAFLVQRAASIEKHEYAKSYYNWDIYYQTIGNYLASTLDKFEKLGVRVVHELTNSQWGKVFNEGSLAVLLIAHWQESHSEHRSCVEFSDGFLGIEEIANQIPLSRQIILDLCVCHPIPLVDLIEEIRPNVRIVYKEIEVDPHLWLLIYLTAFYELAFKSMDYATALERSIANLIYTK